MSSPYILSLSRARARAAIFSRYERWGYALGIGSQSQNLLHSTLLGMVYRRFFSCLRVIYFRSELELKIYFLSTDCI